MVSWGGLRVKRCKTRDVHVPTAPSKPPHLVSSSVTLAPTGVGGGRWWGGVLLPVPGQRGTLAPRPLAVWVHPCSFRQLSPPHIRTPAFPQSPLPHQSTKTSPSLGHREKAGRPPGLGRGMQISLGTEQDFPGEGNHLVFEGAAGHRPKALGTGSGQAQAPSKDSWAVSKACEHMAWPCLAHTDGRADTHPTHQGGGRQPDSTPTPHPQPEHSPEDNSALHPPGWPRGSTCTGPHPPPRTCPRPLQEPGQVRGGEP